MMIGRLDFAVQNCEHKHWTLLTITRLSSVFQNASLDPSAVTFICVVAFLLH